MKMRKGDIPLPVPTIPAMLQKIKDHNVQSQYKVDLIAKELGYDVLMLQCILNSIEMVWNQMKTQAHQLNVFTKEPAKVVKLIREVFEKKILPTHCVNYENHVNKTTSNRSIYYSFIRR